MGPKELLALQVRGNLETYCNEASPKLLNCSLTFGYSLVSFSES